MKTVIAALLGVVLAVSVAAGPTGNTIRGHSEQCGRLLNASMMLVRLQATDGAGMDWAGARARLEPFLRQAMGNPDSYLQTPEDVAYALKVFEQVWEAPNGTDLIETVFNACLAQSGLDT